MASIDRRLRCADYHVAWICPLADVELLPARLMLDEEHSTPPYDTHYDENTYICGTINGHAVVIATCPQGETGNVNAGRLTGPMFKTFPNIRMALLVGIGGGIPRATVSEDPLEDIHLGDVVVGWPGDGKPACVYHDRGRSKVDGEFEMVGTMQNPDWRLTNALGVLASDHELEKTTFADQLKRLQKYKKFAHPGLEHDRLFRAAYHHIGGYRSNCVACDQKELVQRPPRTKEDKSNLVFHRGRIATGNAVIRDGELRDKIGARCNGALCVEMEAVGVDVNSRCLVIRGISDYADSHKDDVWKWHAAGNAAAFARELLCRTQPAVVKDVEGVSEESTSLEISQSRGVSIDMRLQLPRRSGPATDPRAGLSSRWMASFRPSGYDERFQKIVDERHSSTCEWILTCEAVSWWCARRWPSILWVSGSPGVGKSTALTHLVNELLSRRSVHEVGRRSAMVHSFCVDGLNSTASSVLSVAIHQLLAQFPEAKNNTCAFDRNLYMVVDATHNWTPKSGKSRPSFQLWNIFCKLAEEANIDTLFLVIDALDECDLQSQNELLRLFHGSVAQSLCMKLLFSSRTNPELEKIYSRYSAQAPQAFRHEKMEHLEDYINDDIGLYIRTEVARIAKLMYYSNGEQEQIRERLLSERSGMFLPVVLLLREIEGASYCSLEQILRYIPANLGALYGKLFEHLSHDPRPEKQRILKYLAYSVGDITPRDIAYACYALEVNRPTHIALAKGLSESHLNETKLQLRSMSTMVRFRGDEAPVSFIHITAKQYLATLSENRAISNILPKPWNAHTDIAATCLALIDATVKSKIEFPAGYLDAEERDQRLLAIENIPFLEYALRNWYAHLKQAIDRTPETEELNGILLGGIQVFVRLWNDRPEGFRYTLIHYWGVEGLDQNLEAEISIIEVFSVFGLTRCLRMLLEKNSNRYRSVNPRIRRAVLFAVRGGHEGVFDLLVDHFKITSLDGKEYREIITNSAWSGHFSVLEKIMHLRKPNLREFVRATEAAFITGDRRILNRIKADSAIFKDRDGQGRTALHLLFVATMTKFSVRDSSTDVSQGLMLAQAEFYARHGVDINAQDRFGFTALHYVCYAPQLCKRDLLIGLITRDADPMLTTKGGLTPLHLAARYARHPSAIQVLLEVTNNELARMKSLGGNTPLHWAVQRQAIQLEQQHMDRVFKDDGEMMSVLPKICDNKDNNRQRGYIWEEHSPSSFILRLLIDGGADPYIRNKRGLTAIDRMRNHRVGWLLEWGYAHPEIVRTSVAAFRRLNPTPRSALPCRRHSITESHLARGSPSSVDLEDDMDLGTQSEFSGTTKTFYTADEAVKSDTSREIRKKRLWKSWRPL